MDMPAQEKDSSAQREKTGFAVPALPRQIALIDASDSKETKTTFVLDDFEEAFNVYARHDADPGMLAPEIFRFDMAGMDEHDKRKLSHFDTLVIGCALGGRSIERLQGFLAQGTRLYAIAVSDDYKVGHVVLSLTSLKDTCSEQGLSWYGGLAVGADNLIPYMRGKPRMGMLRRRLSEATDKLILAVRCGTDAGTITVPAPIPHFIYHLIAAQRRNSTPRRDLTR